MADIILGVDIGGSHITAGLVDMEAKCIVENSISRNRVNCHGTAEEIILSWVNTIQFVSSKTNIPIERIGLAMPGPFDYEAGICLIKGFDKYEALYEMNIRQILAERLDILPENILFRNDAEAFLEGEVFCGAAKGYTDVIGITLGTGLGSAISHDGVTIDAQLSVTEYNGEIFEESVSTRGLIRNYFNLSGNKVADAKAIADVYSTDLNAQKSFDKFSKDLVWFLTKFINAELPDILVIGGNIANSWSLFMPAVITKLENSVTKMPKIAKALLNEDVALIGGACCFKTAKEETLINK
jgi:glucokinase